jgi:hypothetical protein
MDAIELEDDELDHAVALALGGELDGDGWRFDPPLTLGGEYGYSCSFIKTKRSFCMDWSYGGPIIERYGVWLTKAGDTWSADIPGERGDPERPPRHGEYGAPGHVKGTGSGPTPLIAAMRAFVCSQTVTQSG